MSKPELQIHHAYALVGNQDTARAWVERLLVEDLLLDTQGNPDIRESSHDSYSIEDARTLKAVHYLKGVQGRSIHIVRCNSMTNEAQQSLLKVCEDPVPNVHFFFLIPTLQGILPTLRSRFSIIDIGYDTASVSRAKKFLATSPADRLKLDFIEAFIEDKDKAEIGAFLNELESVVADRVSKGVTSLGAVARDIIQARSFLQSRSPSVKMIIEHMCLTVPTTRLA